MSAAASKLNLESPAIEELEDFARPGSDLEIPFAEREALERLTAVSPPVIACDLDDVLCQTNEAVAEWYNETYGTQMTTAMFYYYYYWKNPFWGTPQETHIKVKNFYSTDRVYRTEPVLGAREGAQALRDLGYHLIIVTARGPDAADESWTWVNKHFPGIFHSIVCTGQFTDAHKAGHEVVTKLSKAQVCADLQARLLIDDSAENAFNCATARQPTPVLLFGEYEWNKRVSGPGDATDEMSFDRRLAAHGGKAFWKEDEFTIPDGIPMRRAKNWVEVVRWVKEARQSGEI